MEKRLPELFGGRTRIDRGATADASTLFRKARPASALSFVVRWTAQTVQMQIYPAPHDPYRKRPAHEKRYAKSIKQHHLASSTPAAELVA
jgi:hypothetical protein